MGRESRAVWERRVRRWERSGLTAKEFAAREGVKTGTLTFWKWKLGQAEPRRKRRGDRDVGFVEVVPSAPSHDVGGGRVEVMVERYRVCVDQGDVSTLERVLDAVRGGGG